MMAEMNDEDMDRELDPSRKTCWDGHRRERRRRHLHGQR